MKSEIERYITYYNEQRIKEKLGWKSRMDFYLRNGYHRTGWGMSYFDVDYEILCSEPDFRKDDFAKVLKRMAVEDFDPEMYRLA